ncbi:MAG: tyrosine-protein phosphatase [Hyphomicrobiaceae bacterium]|nr:tyrosine-protein phosphatase [Hyphomicrobiaceae bacterium]
MGKIAKHQRRAMRRIVRGWRQGIADGAPEWVRNSLGPAVNYADMLLVDHGLFRLFYLNLHRLGPKAWRSAQPAPHQIRHIARLGVRTIVNLRGPRYCGSYWLESLACRRQGVRLVDYQVRSRAAPSKEELLGARDLIRSLDGPVLFHCKSGADRAGLMSTLYLIVAEGRPVTEARSQLSLKYGHIRQADTGILDHFFECYLADNAVRPIEFFDWVQDVYDPDAVKQSFAAKGWANVITNKLLRRE